MSILVVGSIAYDSVRTPFGEAREVLGGSASYFSVAASFFTTVRLVAAVGEDFRPEDRAILEKREIDLGGLLVEPGLTFRWSGEYGYNLNDAQTLSTQLNVFEHFRPELPKGFRDSEFVFLANIDPDLQRQVLTQVDEPKLVALDTMNYWIESKPDALRRTLGEVDLLMVNDAEARQLTGEANLVKAAQRLFEWGPSTLVIKRGEYGVLMFSRESTFAAPAYPLESVLDPTGAGDSFAGGFMGYLANTGNFEEGAIRRAIIMGSVMASFNVEAFSLERLSSLSYRDIEERFRAIKRLTHFEDL
ncbi:MAG: PfkB family carbohydrate kinase [Acidobacteriota bacterium]